jgi:hypothetical protein
MSCADAPIPRSSGDTRAGCIGQNRSISDQAQQITEITRHTA